ncbi:putative retrotransposon protein, partial [Trifolium pratense]
MNAFDMIEHLKTLYQEQARIERFEVSKDLFQAKLSEGSPVSPHVLKMIATDLILQSLPESFNQFVLNF